MQLKFYVFLATVTCLMFSALLHAEARRCCGYCYPAVKPQPTPPRPYVELGLGQAFDSELGAGSGYSFANPREEGTITLALMPNGRILASDILIGGGWVGRNSIQQTRIICPLSASVCSINIAMLTIRKPL